MLTAGQRHDCTQLGVVLNAIRLPRPGGHARPGKGKDVPMTHSHRRGQGPGAVAGRPVPRVPLAPPSAPVPAEAPTRPPRPPDRARRDNLPVPLTPLLGREREVAVVHR